MSAGIHYLHVRPVLYVMPGKPDSVPDSWIERGCCDDELTEDDVEAILEDRPRRCSKRPGIVSTNATTRHERDAIQSHSAPVRPSRAGRSTSK